MGPNALAKLLGRARFLRNLFSAVGKQTHTYHLHMTDEEFALVSARRVLGRHKTLRDYLLSLVARETQFLAKGPCDDCKFGPVFETLLAVAKPKKGKSRKSARVAL
jgi:hypothetical protein